MNTIKRLMIVVAVFSLCLAGAAQADLVHRYSFDTDAADSMDSADGTLMGGATVSGGQLVLASGGQYVDLPSATIAINTYTEVTLEAWVTVGASTPNWSMVASFGLNDGSGTGYDYLLLQGKRGNGNFESGATISSDYWNAEATVVGPVIYNDATEHHLAAVVDATSISLYADGVFVTTTPLTTQSLAGLSNANVYLGKSVYGNDPTSVLNINEFRIYNTALTADEVAASFALGTGLAIANSPIPKNGDGGVAVDTQLTWAGPDAYTAQGYDVYFGTEPNALNAGYDMEKIVDGLNVLTADPGDHSSLADDMDNEVTYFWRVDALEPNAVEPANPTVHTGSLWSFTTVPAVPFFSGQPADTDILYGGEDASFSVTVASTTATTFEWFKEGVAGAIVDDDVNYDIVSDALTSTLTVLGVDAGDAGDYTCLATNAAGSETSDSAELVFAAMIGHWPFDSNFTDAVGSSDGTATPALARAFTPAIGTGEPNSIVGGGAAVFSATYVGDGDNDPAGGAVVIPTPDRLRANNSFTISFWEKSNSAESSRYHIASGPDEAGIGSFFMWRYFDDEFFATNIGEWAGAYPLVTEDLYPEDQWHFLTVTYDASTGDAVTYVNGEEADTGDITTFTGFAAEIYVGNRKNMARPFSGSIDDLKIYNYPLTAIEVAEAYTTVAGGSVCADKPTYDVTGDCKVNFDDFAAMAAKWLECYEYPTCY